METAQVQLSLDTIDRIQAYSNRPLLETLDVVVNRILDVIEDKHLASAKISAVQAERPAPTHFTTSRGVKLPIGLELSASYRQSSPKAVVTAEGIKYNGKTYADPSAAAKQAKLDAGVSETTASTNGWVFWSLKASQSPSGKIDFINVFRK